MDGFICNKKRILSRVRKDFLLLTILVPLIIIGFYTAIIAIAVTGSSERNGGY